MVDWWTCSVKMNGLEMVGYLSPGSVTLGVHVSVVLCYLRPGPVRHGPGPRRVLGVVARPPGEGGLAVEL